MTIQTAVLIETLADLGATVRWASCNIFSSGPRRCRHCGGRPRSLPGKETWKNAMVHLQGAGSCRRHRATLIVDDGGTTALHKGYELEEGSDWVNTPSGNHEEQVIKDLLKEVRSKSP